jgi:hypothetical protein
VTVFHDTAGWKKVKVEEVDFDTTEKRVTIRLNQVPKSLLIRLIVRGTGETPLLDTNLIPLAGSLSDPPASEHNGHDFVLMMKRN